MPRIPEGLPERAYLIAWDRDRQKLRGGHEHGHLVAAAILVELQLAGWLSDQNGRPALNRSPGVRRPATAPGREPMLSRIEASKPRRWRYWISNSAGAGYRQVRDGLALDQLVEVEERRLLGVAFPPRVSVRDPLVVGELVERCRRAVLGDQLVDRVDPLDAALTALVAAAELNPVFSGRERRAHRQRIAELASRTGPVARALRDVVTAGQHAAAGAG